MKKRVNANELQKGDIIYFYDNRNRSVDTREVKEITYDDFYRLVDIIDTNGNEFVLNYHQKFTIDRKSEDINEIKRMQQLAGILKESIEIPKGWSELDIDSDPEWNDPEYDHDVELYSAPMEGWDDEHQDQVYIMSTPSIDEKTKKPLPSDQIKYFISVNYAFGDREDEDKEYDTIDDARRRAVEVMKDIMKNWR